MEPLDLLEITVPERFLGDVLGGLSGLGGHILRTDTAYDRAVVRAVVPQSKLHLYATQLFSLKHGHGQFVRQFNGYEQVPGQAAQKIVAEAMKEREAVEA